MNSTRQKQLILSISLFFTTLTFSMEERVDGSKIEGVRPADLRNLQTNQVDRNQSFFDLLPDEIIEYIFYLLLEDSYTKASAPLEKLIAILSNKDFANIKSVNMRWKSIASDKGIVNKISILTNYLVENNKADFENRLLAICTQNEVDKKNSNDTKILSLLNLCLKKTISVTKQKYLKGLKTNISSLPIELKEKIIKDIQALKTLKCLLRAGVDLNAKDITGKTALIYAALYNNKEAIELIFNHIKNFDINNQLEIINAEDKDLQTALRLVIGDKETAAVILNHIKNFYLNVQLKIINTKGLFGYYYNTALMCAARHKYNESIELILNHIKNFYLNIQIEIINAKDFRKNTALMFAVQEHPFLRSKNKEAVELILNHIKNFDINSQLEIIGAKNDEGFTALDIAKFNSHVEIIKLLEDAINRIEIKDWTV